MMAIIDIYNHAVYNRSGKEMDREFKRCDRCDGEHNYPHICMYYVGLASVDEKEWDEYHGKAWCLKSK